MTDITAELQSKINSGGHVLLDLSSYDGCGIQHLNIPPSVKSFFVIANNPVKIFMLPFIKTNANTGEKYSPSLGLFHFQHNSPTPWSTDFVYFDKNITFDGQATKLMDPDLSDKHHDPLGLKRALIHQITYDESKIKYFRCFSSFENSSASPIFLGCVEDGLISSSFKNINRACVGAVYFQGTSPYNLRFENCTWNEVSSAFDLSRAPGANLIRTTVPKLVCNGGRAIGVHNRTKIHGHWDAEFNKLELRGNGYSGYAGLDIPNETVGEITLNDCKFFDFPSHALTWSFQSGILRINRAEINGSRCPILKQGNINPVVTGPTTYANVKTDLVYFPTANDITHATVGTDWNALAKTSIDIYKAKNLPPRFWWGYGISINGMSQLDYAKSIGWDSVGSKWLA